MSGEQELAALGSFDLDGFEDWDRIVQAAAGQGMKVAFVSLCVGGVIGLNRTARQMIVGTRALKLTYDPKRGQSALASTESDQANSYWIGGYSESRRISAKMFFEHHGITITERIRCTDLQVMDGILIVETGGGEHA